MEVTGSLPECSHLSAQQIMAETEVEEIVGMAATVEPLSSQLQHGSLMFYSVNPPANTIPSLQHFRPAYKGTISSK